ncbi:MAG: rhomboid family intramembrane serine protease [Planctomycetota bacterium]
MGIYDRDYERDERGGYWSGGQGGGGYRPEGSGLELRMPTSIHGRLILLNLALWVLQLLVGRPAWEYFELQADWYTRPWTVYQLLTYGFLHSDRSLTHIAFNMYGLWLFGRQVEARCGSREFLRFYLAAIVLGGAVWTLVEVASPDPPPSLAPQLIDGQLMPPEPRGPSVIGASGAIVAVTILFALNYPHQQIMMMMLFPLPVWVLGCFIVASDMFYAIRFPNAGNVAYVVHLAGAAFAFVYYRQRWRLTDLTPAGFKLPTFKRRPKLRVHREDDEPVSDDAFDAQVDALIDKIQAQGIDSLTAKEKQILERTKRRANQRRS